MTTAVKSQAELSTKEEATIILCVNCGNPVSEKFCGNCGNPKDVKRINIKSIVEDIFNKFLSLDTRFGRTIIGMFKHPNLVISEVLKGNRVKFIGAAGLYFLLLTIYLLLMSLMDISLHDITLSSREALSPGEMSSKELEFSNKVNDMIFNNFRIFGFLMIPFFSFSLMIFFRKSKLNFFEHTVVVFYAFAAGMVFNILTLFIFKFTGEGFQLINMLISIILFTYICGSFYPGKKIRSFLKGFLAYALGYTFFMIAFAIGIIVMLLNNLL